MSDRRTATPDRLSDPMLGVVNGLIGSLAMWALIAGVVAVAS